MTWGADLKFLLEIKESTGVTPKSLLDRPTLSARQSYFTDVFEDLTDSRTYSATGTPLPIPLSEILTYFEMFYIDGISEREQLLKMMRTLDRTFIRVVCKQVAQKSKTDTKTVPALPR